MQLSSSSLIKTWREINPLPEPSFRITSPRQLFGPRVSTIPAQIFRLSVRIEIRTGQHRSGSCIFWQADKMLVAWYRMLGMDRSCCGDRSPARPEKKPKK